jgi:DNA mismatch repair protein MSH2
MLYQLRDGPCTESFGVFVAQSAGFPKEVIQEAKRKAHVLEGKAHLDEDDEKGHSMVKQGKEKMRKMRHHLDEFSGLNVPAMPSTELKSILGQLFPAEMLISH